MAFQKAALTTFLTNLVIQGCNVIAGGIASRLLQPEGRGELATVILWPTILAGLGIMGTNWARVHQVYWFVTGLLGYMAVQDHDKVREFYNRQYNPQIYITVEHHGNLWE